MEFILGLAYPLSVVSFIVALAWFGSVSWRMIRERRGASVLLLFAPLLIVHHSVGAFGIADVVGDFHGVNLTYEVLTTFYLALTLMYGGMAVGISSSRNFHFSRLDSQRMANSIAGLRMHPFAIFVLLLTAGIILYEIAARGSLDNAVKVFTLQGNNELYREIRQVGIESAFLQETQFLRFTVLPYAICYSYIQMRRGHLYYRLLFAALVTLALAWALVTASKFFFFFVPILVLIAEVTMGRLGKKALLRIGAAAAACLLLAPFLYSAQYGLSFLEGAYATYYRLFVEPNRGLVLHFYAYPDLIKFNYAMDSRLADIIGATRQRVSYAAIPEQMGVFGTVWNVAFVGQAWTSFGWFGLLILPPVVGVTLGYIDKVIARYLAFDEVKSLLCVLAFAAMKLANVAFWSVLIGFGLLTGLLVFYVCYSRVERSRRDGNRFALPRR